MKKYNRQAVYIGRCWLKGGKVGQSFLLLPERREMTFAGIKGLYIGYTYACMASKMPIRPEMVERQREDNPKWEAQDALIDAHRAKERANAKYRGEANPSLRAAGEALRPLVEGIPLHEVRELVNFLVLEAMMKTTKGKKK